MLSSNGVKKTPPASYLLGCGKHMKIKAIFKFIFFAIFGNQISLGVAQDPEGRMS